MPVLFIARHDRQDPDPLIDRKKYRPGDVVAVLTSYDISKASAREKQGFWIVEVDGNPSDYDVLMEEILSDPDINGDQFFVARRKYCLDVSRIPECTESRRTPFTKQRATIIGAITNRVDRA